MTVTKIEAVVVTVIVMSGPYTISCWCWDERLNDAAARQYEDGGVVVRC